ncbi:hypothetical protein DRO48_01935 [Candidatus Bathyarchaeota archaeon]|nr:MAG: hypothetical protein DRO48_01935 [Candidatus Bathyarchaeota archaeon]
MTDNVKRSLESQILELLADEPYTATELSRIVKAHHLTVSRILTKLMMKNPRIRSKKIGRYEIFWIEEDKFEDYVRFVKENTKLSPRARLLVQIYNLGGITPERAVPLSNFTDAEKAIIDELADDGRVIITTNGRVYLTEIGCLVAKGAKLVHSL